MTDRRGGPGASARRARSRFGRGGARWLAVAGALLAAACHDPAAPVGPEPGPPPEAQPPRFARIAAGMYHFCALTDAGAPYCWGNDSYGAVSARAETTFDTVGVDRPTRPSLPWRPLPRFTQLAAGSSRSCALAEGGAAHCWGTTLLGGATLIVGGTASLPEGPWRELTVGGTHACALTAEGEAWCWGASYYGELGTGRIDGSAGANLPARVATSLRFSHIAAGYTHTCALTTDGAPWCWGSNLGGELGTTTPLACRTASSRPTPFQCSGIPVPVQTTLRFVSLTAGGSAACAITATRETWCWGSTIVLPEPRQGVAPVRVDGRGGAPPFVSMAVGSAHGCGITEEGAAWCWGANTSGELGIGHANEPGPSPWVREPTPVVGGIRFRAIALSSASTCGVDVEGALYCWGNDVFGTLGIGRADPERCINGVPCSTRPVRVVVPAPATGASSTRG